jgi:hypothetical protein
VWETCPFTEDSGEGDQGSGVMPISVQVGSDQVIGASDAGKAIVQESDRNRQEELGCVATDFSRAVPAFRSPFRTTRSLIGVALEG